jgi:hypothetical protein
LARLFNTVGEQASAKHPNDAEAASQEAAQRLANVLNTMVEYLKAERSKNAQVRVLRFFQFVAGACFVIGLIVGRAAHDKDAKMNGLIFAAIGFIGLLVVEGIARSIGRLQ